jgi:hypothetical protein
MQPDSMHPIARALALLVASATLASCGLIGKGAQRESAIDAPSTAIERSANPPALTQHFDAIQKLLGADPAAQAELVLVAQREADASRLASARLRHALLLGTPGHGGHDPAAAVTILRDILSVPATLPPAERVLAQIELQRLVGLGELATEIKRMRDQAARTEREQVAALNRRLQNEQEENARLRKALEEARSKLDAIGKIETGDRRP